MIRWLREFDRSYLVVGDENLQEESFEWKMLLKNQPEGLLPMQTRKLNGKLQLYFDISMKQDLSALYARSGMPGSDLRKLLWGIRSLSEHMRSYMLSSGDILLSPECIYIDRDSGEYVFACIPGRSRTDPDSSRKELQTLAEWLLKHLNHSDEDAVLVGYDIYHRVMENPDSFTALLEKYSTQASRAASEDTLRTRDGFGYDPENQNAETSPGAYRMHEGAGYPGNPSLPPRGRHQEGVSGEKPETAQRSFMADQAGRSRPGRKKKADRAFVILALILGAVGIAADVLLIFFFCTDYTQAGGVILVTLAVIWLILRMAGQRMKSRYGPWDAYLENGQDQQQYLEQLLAETFGDTEAAGTVPEFLNGQIAGGRQRTAGTSEDETLLHNPKTDGMHAAAAAAQKAKARDPLTRVLSVSASGSVRLKALGEGEDIPLKGERIILGSSPETADAVIDSEVISRVHARLEHADNEWIIIDLNSRNGTSVNGTMLLPNERKPLESGDEIMFADRRYMFML